MSVRKRTWTGSDGKEKSAWVVDYTDNGGKRRSEQFDRKTDAEARHDQVRVNVRAGIHTVSSTSPTVKQAGLLWLQTCENKGLERTTLKSYREHLNLHIAPLLGTVRLSQLTVPMVRSFEDTLHIDRSPAMVTKVLTSLSSLIQDAMERGLVAQNVAHSLRAGRRGRRHNKHLERHDERKAEIGVNCPTPDEIRALMAHLAERWRPFFLTAIFTGLRSSELRGLRWPDVDLKHGEIQVRQRADDKGKIGSLKSVSAKRVVPLPAPLLKVLREWRLACPKGPLDLVLPNSKGKPAAYNNIVEHGLYPAMIAAGVVTKNGRPKYTGLHMLRHFYASWCINRTVDGGLELPLKVVSTRLGHASIKITADTYGHLFPRGDDSAALSAAAAKMLLI
jgi:integrase